MSLYRWYSWIFVIGSVSKSPTSERKFQQDDSRTTRCMDSHMETTYWPITWLSWLHLALQYSRSNSVTVVEYLPKDPDIITSNCMNLLHTYTLTMSFTEYSKLVLQIISFNSLFLYWSFIFHFSHRMAPSPIWKPLFLLWGRWWSI